MAESTPRLRSYVDVCCLNRPCDDQRQAHIRLEAEAVLLILGHCEAGVWQWISRVTGEEAGNNTPSRERGSRVRSMRSGVHGTVALTDAAVARAQAVKAMGGFEPMMPGMWPAPKRQALMSASRQLIAGVASRRAIQRS